MFLGVICFLFRPSFNSTRFAYSELEGRSSVNASASMLLAQQTPPLMRQLVGSCWSEQCCKDCQVWCLDCILQPALHVCSCSIPPSRCTYRKVGAAAGEDDYEQVEKGRVKADVEGEEAGKME